MILDTPSFDDLRGLLEAADPGTFAELNAFHGVGLWTPEGEAARLAALAREWPAHTIRDEAGVPMLVMGLSMQRVGVVQTWCVCRDGWQAYNRAVVACYQSIVAGIFAGGIHRITVESLAGRPRVREWFAGFGYVYEGTQRGAGVQGEDIDIYGMTKGAG